MIYRPMQPKKLRRMLQREQMNAVAEGCSQDPSAIREKLLSMISVHQSNREEYADLFIQNTVGTLNEASACAMARWMTWDDIHQAFNQSDTTLPPRREAIRELLMYIGAVLKHNKDIRYLDFPA